MGISRQAVHQAIHRGDLDALAVRRDNGEVKMIVIPTASVEAFKAKRRERELQRKAG